MHSATCPICNYWSQGIRPKPRENDVFICSYCISILLFDENLKLRTPTQQELIHIRSNVDFQNTHMMFHQHRVNYLKQVNMLY